MGGTINKFKRVLSLALVLSLSVSVAIFGGCDSEVSSTLPGTTVSEKVSETATDETTRYTTEEFSETQTEKSETTTEKEKTEQIGSKSEVDSIPKYSGVAYVVLNGNEPSFTKSEITDKFFESYSSLDSLGRCGVAFACLGRETMPTDERGSIGQVKPSGWHTVKYDCVDGKYLYNRCHLIGFQLSGENANVKNLITGTRYLNIEGMLPFENMVADYIKETNNHVMYRVTPIFEGGNLVAGGVQMEAYSVEDNGDGICFNVYCYNVQPGVEIDYRDGTSEYSGEYVTDVTTPKVVYNFENKSNSNTQSAPKDNEKTTKTSSVSKQDYILNINTKKFHRTTCRYAKSIKEENRSEYKGARDDLINKGYSPCGTCNP